MKKQQRPFISSATLAAIALALSAYGVSHAQQTSTPPSTGSSSSSSQQSGSTTPGSPSNSTGVIQSGGQSGQPGGSSFGQGAKDSTSTAPGNSAFGQSRDEDRRNDPAREEERKRTASDITASTTPPTTTTDPATGTTPSPSTDSTLSPTGKRGSEMTPTAPPALITAASTVRQAIDANTSFSTYNVIVVPQGDHLVLRGLVADAATAQSVLDFAKLKAGSDVKIENQIEIKMKSN